MNNNEYYTNEDFLNSWLTSTKDFVFFKDLNGIYRKVSNTTAIWAGFDNASEMIGKNDFEIFQEDSAKSFIANDKKVIKGKKEICVQNWIYNKAGNKILLETIETPVFDENGKVIALQGISKDITSNFNLNNEFTKNQALLSAIVNNIPLALWIKDYEGRYLLVNSEYEQFYGVKKADILNKDVMTILNSEHIASNNTINNLREADKQIYDEKVCSKAIFPMNINNEPRYIEIVKAPVIDNGNCIALLGISHDVTDSINYEKLLVKSKELAESSNKSKSEFLANMSHEIRTPMNGILGFIQLLEDTSLDIEQKDFVNEIRKSSEILLGLLNDILDLSKIEAGKMSMENISFNLRYVLEDIATLASSSIANKPIEINVLCYSDIPEKVYGDPTRLKQVLNNFVTNAIKFTAQGEINISAILLNKTDDEVKILFEIQDTGIGISKENQTKIFDAFVQADSSTTRKYGGTGLGLTISKNIIHLLGGEVYLQSTENVGSAFSFSAVFKTDKNDNNDLQLSNVSLKDKNILVVDDNKTNLKVIEHYLKLYGCNIVVSSSAVIALDILNDNKQKFDIILTDYCMPDMDGISFSKTLQKIPEYSSIPIVLLTSRAQIGDCKAAKENNLRGYLPKPLRKNELVECICLILNDNEQSQKVKSTLITKHVIKEIYHKSKYKILVTEDNVLNQKLAIKMLNKAGFQCDIANNGQEAVDTLKIKSYDLIFMDCQMPVLDGYKATKQIREFNTTVPIIALTANVVDSDVKECLDAGMSDYLSKPLIYERLIELTSKYLPERQEEDSTDNALLLPEETNEDSLDDIVASIKNDLGIDEEDAKMLLDEFWEELDKMLKELAVSIENNEFEQVAQIAHSLKGASGNLRIKAIFKWTSELEIMGKNNNLSEAKNIIEKITTYYIDKLK